MNTDIADDLSDQEKHEVTKTVMLIHKIVDILESNLSKEELLEFQLFIDGNGPSNLFDELLAAKAMELAPELFLDDESEELTEGHYVDSATQTGMYDHDY